MGLLFFWVLNLVLVIFQCQSLCLAQEKTQIQVQIQVQKHLQTQELDITFKGCTSRTQSKLLTLYKSLPKQFKLSSDEKLMIRCADTAFAYGFDYQLKSTTIDLSLGKVAPIKARRALYRLDHLNSDELKDLWHQRGLVHSLMYKATLQARWHLHPTFLSINMWDKKGKTAQNLDEWAYSRPLGQQNALMDLVTFAEEWLVRPARRKTLPDNRIECQSFSKGRFIKGIFEGKAPERPPEHCHAFWLWSKRYPLVEVLFTSPSSSPISSFGHLALVLRSHDGTEPEYMDPVYQYVGLVSMNNGHKSMTDSLFNTVPLILQADEFFRFDQQTRLRENRNIYRFKAKLNAQKLVWFKAILWEQIRRLNVSYRFLTTNCAEMMLKLFGRIFPDADLNQAGMTTSPMGAISLLRQQGLIQDDPYLTASLSQSLAQIKAAMEPQLQILQDQGIDLPPFEALTPKYLKQWQKFLLALGRLNRQTRTLLHHIQDYFDLSVWEMSPEPVRSAPIKSIELLKLKHDLFHEEKMAKQVVQQMSEWYEKHFEHKQKVQTQDQKSKRAQAESLADQLVEAIANKLDTEDSFEQQALAAPIISQLELLTKKWPGELPNRVWGSDASISLGLGRVNASRQSKGYLVSHVNFTLYDEIQGQYRSILNPANRDLKWLSVSFLNSSNEPFSLNLTPIYLHSRSGLFKVNRWGALLDLNLGYTNSQFYTNTSLGTSFQVARWSIGQTHNLGDLSFGVKLNSMINQFKSANFAVPVFGTLSLPLWNKALFKAQVWKQGWSSNHLVSYIAQEEGLKTSLEIGIPLKISQTLSVILSYEQNHLTLGQEQYSWTSALRLQ